MMLRGPGFTFTRTTGTPSGLAAREVCTSAAK